jgi:chaperonin GroES
MNLRPLEDRIVVKAAEAETTSPGGIVLPANAQEKPQEGEVLATGPGRFNEALGELVPMTISVGDKVVYSKYGGTEVTSEGEDYLILTARDVLAVVELRRF